VTRVTAGIIESDGLVLLARRRPGKHMGGKWELPGGKIEPGETPEQSLARELAEELAVQAQVGELIGSCTWSGDGLSLELLVYRARITAGVPQLLEHEEIRWVKPTELLSYDLADSDRTVISSLSLR
jgi:8-oxo-dGTP diphosphatase